MGNSSQKLHGSRADAPLRLEGDGCKLVAGAVMMALVGGGFAKNTWLPTLPFLELVEDEPTCRWWRASNTQ